MDRRIPFNEIGADAVLATIKEPEVQNLVRLVIATARTEFMRKTTQSEEDWEAHLPAAPFDMEFFARVLAKTLSRSDSVRRILNGESIAEVSGWDV